MGTLLADSYLNLRAWVANNYKLRERLLILGLFLLAYLVGMRALTSYKLFFLAIAAGAIAILALHRLDIIYLITLFYTTIYLTLTARFLSGVPGVLLIKEALMGLVIGVLIFQLVVKQRPLYPCDLHKTLVVWLLMLTAQCFNPSVYGFWSVVDDYRLWVMAIGSFFVANQLLDSDRRLMTFIHIILAYGFLEATYGVVQHFIPTSYITAMGGDFASYFTVMKDRIRSFSTMDTVHFAIFAFMLTPIAMWKMNDSKDFFKRCFFACMVGSCIVGGAFTLVRGAWVSFLLALMVSSIFFKRPVYLLLVILVILIAFTSTSGVMKTRVESLLNWEQDASIQTRLDTLVRVREAVVFRVFGYGLGTFSHSRFTMMYMEKIIYGRATENFYLLIFLETGWIGFAIYLWLMFLIYRRAYRNFTTLKNRRYRQLSAAVGTVVFFIDIAKLSGPCGYYVPESWHYWFFVAALYAMARLDEQSEEQAGEQTVAVQPVPAIRPAG